MSSDFKCPLTQAKPMMVGIKGFLFDAKYQRDIKID